MRLRIGRVLAALVVLLYPVAAGMLLLSTDGWSINRLNVAIWLAVTAPFHWNTVITPEQFAVGANVVLFIPLFAALAVLVPTWWWVLLGVGLSTAVEVYQASLGGLRIASAVDVLANSLGAVIGVLLGRWIHRVLRRADLRED